MSSLTTCSSTEDEFSSDVFGQGGNAEVNDGGTTSVSADVNSRKTAIGDGGMKRKMTELFILTVVNITVTVALISFITPNENARINADELESLKKSVGKMEQQHGNNAGEQKLSQFQNDQKKLLEKISEMEKQSKVSGDELSKSQNDQKNILEKISELEKQTKKKVFLKFQKNCWDAFACHEDIEISGDKSLIVQHKGNESWHAVFAKYPIVLNKHLSDFFYYEISVMKRKYLGIIFGFAVKQQTKLDALIQLEKGTYAFYNYGYLWINGKGKGRNAEYSYGVDDTVGIGVHLITRQLFFTKNGLRLDTSDFLVDPSFADGSFYPFVSLFFSDDKIETNFGPNFKFDLATL